MNLSKLLENTAERLPDRIAVRFEGRDISFDALNRRVNRLANGLRTAGLNRGDRCILMMPSGIDFICSYYALAKLGAAIIPVNFLYRVHELAHISRDSGARAFIGMAPYLEEARKVLADLPQIRLRVAADAANDPDFEPLSALNGPEDFRSEEMDDQDTLAILYTSGTTGAPKGAMLTHKNLTSNAMTVADMRQNGPEDVVIGVLPLYHIYGQTSAMNASIYLGLTFHVFRAFEPRPVLDMIETETSTILIAVPTILNRLLAEAERAGLRRSSLRYCVSGGASLPVEILRKFEDRFQVRIYEGYGLTECSPVCVENPFGKKTKPGSIGLPIPGFEARVVSPSRSDVPVGEVGELLVRGPGVMKGYLNRPEATAAAVVDGWLHTGDMARMDAEGYITIVDRKKDMIIRGGYNVYPREVEEVLFQHPAVFEAGVYGVPHADLGEEVAANVVLQPDSQIGVQELRDFVRARLAPYKYPRIIRLVNELPKSHTGKVLKRELRREWSQPQTHQPEEGSP